MGIALSCILGVWKLQGFEPDLVETKTSSSLLSSCMRDHIREGYWRPHPEVSFVLLNDTT